MAMMDKPITIYKVGGSLYRLPDLAERLTPLLSYETDTLPLLISGGGATADLVRQWDRQFQLGEAQAHRLAMQSLKLNSELLHLLLPNSKIVTSLAAARVVWERQGIPILDTAAYLIASETKSLPLPHSWDVTSDSIAAWVAIHWPADRLMLLKSVDLPAGLSIPAACEANLVDNYFRQLANKMPTLDWVNMNNDQRVVIHWC